MTISLATDRHQVIPIPGAVRSICGLNGVSSFNLHYSSQTRIFLPSILILSLSFFNSNSTSNHQHSTWRNILSIALTSKHGDTELQGHQQHHSLSNNHREESAVTMDEANEPEIEEMQMDISAGQKMLSAVSGSLLTSLLGE